MFTENGYIYRKEVDWSLLQQGLTIPVSLQMQFKFLIKQALPRGATIPIKIIIDGELYDAKLTNQNFDINKYATHKDIVQVRYTPNSLIAQKMREIFSLTYQYCINFKQNQDYKKYQVNIPKNQKEYVVLYTTSQQNVFLAEYITSNEIQYISNELFDFDEDEFELGINYNRADRTARIEQKQQMVKIRKLDKSICDNLKELYNFRCQITAENFSEYYGTNIVEAHHIDYFTKSLNNNSDNILIISPNYHRLIHKLNPVFDRQNLCFKFENGLIEKIKINLHL